MSRRRPLLDRRTFLRGAGTVAIALPFLPEMGSLTRVGSAAQAQPAPSVSRCFTVFFAHGVPLEVLRGGLTGPLAPLARLQDKLGIYGGVDLHAGSGNGHATGGMSVFVGAQRANPTTAGGPSIEQVVRGEVGDGGTPFPFLNVGTFFRDNDVFRYVHSWSDDGQPAQARPLGQPTAVFDRLFGGSGAPAPEGGVSDRLRRSVLDTVLDDYRHLTGDAGGLGVESRARIHEHLERLRELERRLDADPVDPGACAVPDPVATDPRLWEEDQEEAPSKPTIVPENWIRHWDLLTEIYAMGIRCDLFRFGNVTFQGAAERAFLRGPYDYDGRTVLFDDRQDHHEAWHGYNGLAVPQDRMAWHMHFILDQTVRFLEKLDDPAYPTESGGTLLDDSLVVVGTELGDGSRHATRDVFHAVSSAGGRLATGVVDEGAMMQVDFLNTCLQAVGIDRSMGDERRAEGPVDRMLA